VCARERQVCVSELVMVVVGEATEYAIRNGRRTLMAQDILWALRELGVWAPCRLCLLPFALARVLAAQTLYSLAVLACAGLEVYTASLETLLDKLRAQQQSQHQALAPEFRG
jgi:hypothetical protein